MLVKVKEHDNLVRDVSNQAILNTDYSAVRRHAKRMSDLENMEQQAREINTLRDELIEIRAAFRQLESLTALLVSERGHKD